VLRTAYEADLLGSAGTLWQNRNWLDEGESFFIVYGDVLTKMDLNRMLAAHRRHGAPFTMGLFQTKHPRACGIASVSRTGDIIAFEEKPEQPRSSWAAAGVYVADTRIFDYYPRPFGRPLDLGFHILPRLVGNMKAFFIEEMLIDIGSPDAYTQAQRMWTNET
jgi:NDP-sugar pyrophosphorylase family protein